MGKGAGTGLVQVKLTRRGRRLLAKSKGGIAVRVVATAQAGATPLGAERRLRLLRR